MSKQPPELGHFVALLLEEAAYRANVGGFDRHNVSYLHHLGYERDGASLPLLKPR